MNIKKDEIMWSRNDIKLFLIITALGFIAKGAAAFRGMSVDDYPFSLGASEWSPGHFLSQGRFFGALVSYLIDAIGVNLNDTYFSMALLVIALQAALAVSVMRLLGYKSLMSGVIIGGLIALHPYNAEFLTFKHILPVYALALVFTIGAIELLQIRTRGIYANISIVTAILAALMTYQAALNYILVAAYGCLLMSFVSTSQGSQSSLDSRNLRASGWLLIFLSFLATLLFFGSLLLVKNLGLVENLTGRASLIGSSEVSVRVNQILTTLDFVFLKPEPVFPISLKLIYFSLSLVSVALIVLGILRYRRGLFTTCFGLVLLVIIPFLSLGIIIPLNEWWPVPRVIAHGSLLFGLIILVAERSVAQASFNAGKLIFIFAGYSLILGFIFVNNQIFADQQTIAQWDRFKANRIVSQLENNPDFHNIKRLYVNGGVWGYPVTLRTLQGDMNISAFFPPWSKRPLILESSGYKFGRPSSDDIKTGVELCLDREVWPGQNSVFVHGELAIVCLDKLP